MFNDGTRVRASEAGDRSHFPGKGAANATSIAISSRRMDGPWRSDFGRRTETNTRIQPASASPLHSLSAHESTGSKLLSLELSPGSTKISLANHYVLCLSIQGSGRISIKQPNRTWEGETSPGAFLPLLVSTEATIFDTSGSHKLLLLAIPTHPSKTSTVFSKHIVATLSTRSFRNPFLRQLFLSFSSCVKDKDTFDRFQRHLISFVEVALSMQATKTATQDSASRKLTNREWSTIESYICKNIHRNITVSCLSKAIDLAQSAFVRAFRAKTSLTPYQYILRHRVSTARDLILNTPLSLVDVALQSGFADQAHMTSTFTRLTDTTPGRLRRSC